MLIEDHQALRQGLELLLDREGCEVVGAAGTAEEGRPERAIVLYTGSSDVEQLISGLDSGARGYALKEGTPAELTSAIHAVAGEQVAARLVLSSETVKTHIRNAMGKLEASTRVHPVAIALRDGLISPPRADGGRP